MLGLWRQFEASVGGAAPSDEFVRASYVYASCLVHRSAALAQSGAHPDGNDFEDAEICRHLWIGGNAVLVTADKTLQGLSTNAVETWEEHEGGPARVGVCDVAGLAA